MILLADSGSTKTTWVTLESGQVSPETTTAGLNPYFHTRESIEQVLEDQLLPGMGEYAVREVHFYGAGCSTPDKNDRVKQAILRFFPGAEVSVYHDILGAARALLGKQTGIACILGTGCNACYYDGVAAESRVASLGYLFGDEGAGSNIGKRFMEAFLKERLPQDLLAEFSEFNHLSFEQILESLYNKPYPNRFLASFSEFIAPRRHHPFLHSLVKASIGDFFTEQLSKYQGYQSLPVGFVGSIAWIYQDILKEVATERGVTVTSILRSPMEGLVRFHGENLKI